MRSSIIHYCAAIGADSMLVQGAGGNVSWKDGDTLWIKASGTWLSDAAREDIFVPVDLAHLEDAIAEGNFAVSPRVRGEATLRPSIETLLHALMPHPVVVHLHAVEVLAHLIRHNGDADIAARLGSRIRSVSTTYHKPGAALAEAVKAALACLPEAEVVLLQNHGIVIGGSDVDDVDRILRAMTSALATPSLLNTTTCVPRSSLVVRGSGPYEPVSDPDIHKLATEPILFNRLLNDWALYPDHVVFLGPQPACYSNLDELLTSNPHDGVFSELIFVRGLGVFTQPTFNTAKLAQLRCYYDVLCRQPEGGNVISLTGDQIAELLNWDAEQYRLNIAKTILPE